MRAAFFNYLKLKHYTQLKWYNFNRKEVLLMKKWLIPITAIMILTGCGSDDSVNTAESEKKTNLADVVTDLIDPKVSIVRDGTFNNYPTPTIGEAFQNYFGNPKWNSFTSDTGETIVEFRGTCMYADVEVEALFQFIVNEEANTFEVNYLAFNEVPQSELILAALLSSVYEDQQVEDIPQSVKADDYYAEDAIMDAQYSYFEEYPELMIGEVFTDDVFTDLYWEDAGDFVIVSGYYNGEIFPGEGSFVRFDLVKINNEFYKIDSVLYNDTWVPDREGIDIIMDVITTHLYY